MNTTKKSLKDRIREYLIKNINYIVPGILMLGGSIYYPENYRRHQFIKALQIIPQQPFPDRRHFNTNAFTVWQHSFTKPQLMAISKTDSELSSIKMAAFLMQYHETKKIGVHCA